MSDQPGVESLPEDIQEFLEDFDNVEVVEIGNETYVYATNDEGDDYE